MVHYHVTNARFHFHDIEGTRQKSLHNTNIEHTINCFTSWYKFFVNYAFWIIKANQHCLNFWLFQTAFLVFLRLDASIQCLVSGSCWKHQVSLPVTMEYLKFVSFFDALNKSLQCWIRSDFWWSVSLCGTNRAQIFWAPNVVSKCGELNL